VGVRGVHRGVVRVAIIGFLRAEGDSGGRRTTVSCVRRGAGARLPCSPGRRASGGGSISSRLRLYGRHAAAAVGRGRARAVNDRLLQADQCLGGHINRRLVHWRLCLEHAMHCTCVGGWHRLHVVLDGLVDSVGRRRRTLIVRGG
jgi:hypothetical protein